MIPVVPPLLTPPTPCPACGQSVGALEPRCPHCGADRPRLGRKALLPLVVLVAVAVGLVLFVAGSEARIAPIAVAVALLAVGLLAVALRR